MLSTTQEGFDLYQDLPPSILKQGQVRIFNRGLTLFEKDDAVDGLYFILSGVVGLVGLGVNGEDTLLRVVGRKRFMGYRSLLGDDRYHATALALSEVEAIQFPLNKKHEVFSHFPELFVYLSKTLAFDLRTAEERLRNFTGKRALSRVVESLIYLKQVAPEHLWTRKEIGGFCGARTETVTRILSKLEVETS